MQWRKWAVLSVVAENFGMPNLEHDPTLYTKQNTAQGKNSAVDHVNHGHPVPAGSRIFTKLEI
jgi:acyl dehydratase